MESPKREESGDADTRKDRTAGDGGRGSAEKERASQRNSQGWKQCGGGSVSCARMCLGN